MPLPSRPFFERSGVDGRGVLVEVRRFISIQFEPLVSAMTYKLADDHVMYDPTAFRGYGHRARDLFEPRHEEALNLFIDKRHVVVEAIE